MLICRMGLRPGLGRTGSFAGEFNVVGIVRMRVDIKEGGAGYGHMWIARAWARAMASTCRVVGSVVAAVPLARACARACARA